MSDYSRYKGAHVEVTSHPNKDGRYILVDGKGRVVDAAGGYGFKSWESANARRWAIIKTGR